VQDKKKSRAFIRQMHAVQIMSTACRVFVAFSDFVRISVFIHDLLSLTLVLFCGMCFTADFVIVYLKTFHTLVPWQSLLDVSWI
jgi:hypothetical protein